MNSGLNSRPPTQRSKKNIDSHIYYPDGLLRLPGTAHKIANGHGFADGLFFIVFAAIPSSFFALVDQNIFYYPGTFDLRALFILAAIPYLLIFFSRISKIVRLPGIKALIVLCVYIVCIGIYSWVRGIPGTEIVTVARINFIYPIICLGFLLYAAELDIDRLFRLFKWMLLATFIQGVLYILSNFFGIEIFAAKVKDPLQYGGVVLYQNVFAIPQFNEILFSFAFVVSMLRGRFIFHLMWSTALIVILLSFVRNQLIVYVLYFLLLSMLTVFATKRLGFGRAFKFFIFLGVIALVYTATFPSHAMRFAEKIGFDSKRGAIEKVDTGTFDLRVRAIEWSYNRLKKHNNLLTGNGYVRISKKGQYDFVMGGDTLIAPVLLAEGILGFTLRLLPVVILLYVNIKSFWRPKEKKYRLYSLITIALIVPAITNIVQTGIFTRYHQMLFVLFLLEIIKWKFRSSDSNRLLKNSDFRPV